MKKIAFHISNKNISKVDFRNLLGGNPGVGGSEYLIVLTAWLLSTRNNDIDITLYAESFGLFPKELNVVCVTDVSNAFAKASAESFDIIVVDHKRLNGNDMSFCNVRGPLKVVCWCHNFLTSKELNLLSTASCVKRVVFVGREQMDLYRDDKIFLKSDYIYNCVPVEYEYIEKAKAHPYASRPHSLAYLGSLVKGKNFHILASIWKQILSRIPDAQLYVIGSGKVYSKDVILGKYNFAEDGYESLFMKYLTDDYGEILSSVHFLGAMGKEKYDVLLNVKVGCPNPTGDSETFCLSAVEMQAMGCTVAAMEAPGYYDTFYNGKISKSKDELIDDIVDLLNRGECKEYYKTLAFIKDNFSPEVVAKKWEKLLHSDMNCYLNPLFPIANPSFRHKRVKEMLRRLKKLVPVLYGIPCLDRFISLKNRYFS